jgi:hypothetical protein
MLQPNTVAMHVFCCHHVHLNVNLKFGCMVQYILLIVFAMKSMPLVVSKGITVLVGVFMRNYLQELC